MRAYGLKALRGEVAELRAATKGGRNWDLFITGSKIGKYIHHGALSREEVLADVLPAIDNNGLLKEDGRRRCLASLESGYRKAEGDALPDLEDRPLDGNKAKAGAKGANGAAHNGAGLNRHDGSARVEVREPEDEDAAEDTNVKPWPILNSTAAHGLVGQIARCATHASEADPVAVISTVLAWAAACFGRGRLYRVGDTLHHARLYCALVGDSSRARKGTSLGPVQRVFREAEKLLKAKGELPFPSGLPLNISHGLSTGEGLTAEVRNKRHVEDQAWAKDKRLLVIEREFGSILKQFQRPGNTLSTTMRTSWDGWDLGAIEFQERPSDRLDLARWVADLLLTANAAKQAKSDDDEEGGHSHERA